MRALILSCNTGEGHNSCAAALQEYFTAQGTPCEIADALGFLSQRASQWISHWHTRIYRYAPDLFRQGYAFVERHPALFREQSQAVEQLQSGNGKVLGFLMGQVMSRLQGKADPGAVRRVIQEKSNK